MFEIPVKRWKRQILHIDADAFFASVEQVLNPHLKGKPVIVGGPSKKRGIVSAASYEAKKFGLHSGMPMYLAVKKCPDGIVVNGHFAAYREFSQRMYDVFCEYTPEVEMASVDEAYLDITGCEAMHKMDAALIARSILMEVNRRLGISVSCGLASSKVVAKVASSINKPHKLTVVPFGSEEKFLAPLELRKMPGVGPKTAELLNRHGFYKIGDVAGRPVSELIEVFGIEIIPLWKRSMGIDGSKVVSVRAQPKSISKEHTFYTVMRSKEACVTMLKELSVKVFEKLRGHRLKARTVFVKIRYKSDFQEKRVFSDFSFQRHLDFVSSNDRELWPVVKELFLESVMDEPVRLVGVGVSNLIDSYNLSLFGNENENRLWEGVDKIRKIEGNGVIGYGV